MAIVAVSMGVSIVPATSSHVIELLVVVLSGISGPSGSSAELKADVRAEFPVWALHPWSNPTHVQMLETIRSIHTFLFDAFERNANGGVCLAFLFLQLQQFTKTHRSPYVLEDSSHLFFSLLSSLLLGSGVLVLVLHW